MLIDIQIKNVSFFRQEIQVRIVDNDVYEFDEEFFVRLSAPKAVNARNSEEKYPAVLGSANEALVIIVDDDHAGHFGFESQVYRVMENQGIFYLKVMLLHWILQFYIFRLIFNLDLSFSLLYN